MVCCRMVCYSDYRMVSGCPAQAVVSSFSKHDRFCGRPWGTCPKCPLVNPVLRIPPPFRTKHYELSRYLDQGSFTDRRSTTMLHRSFLRSGYLARTRLSSHPGFHHQQNLCTSRSSTSKVRDSDTCGNTILAGDRSGPRRNTCDHPPN